MLDKIKTYFCIYSTWFDRMVSLCGKSNDSKLLDDAKKSKPLNVRAFPRDANNNGCV